MKGKMDLLNGKKLGKPLSKDIIKKIEKNPDLKYIGQFVHSIENTINNPHLQKLNFESFTSHNISCAR